MSVIDIAKDISEGLARVALRVRLMEKLLTLELSLTRLRIKYLNI